MPMEVHGKMPYRKIISPSNFHSGSYKGQWLRGMRHGYGIRTSAQWGVATKQKSGGGPGSAHTHASLSSLRSNYGSVAMDDETAAAMDTPNHTGRSHSRERRGADQQDQGWKCYFQIT